MKRFLSLFTAILLICLFLFPLYVNAEEKSAKFTTDVPERHSIHINLNGQGPILINDSPYNDGDVVTVDDHGSIVVKLPPDANLRINKIAINGEDVTEKFINNIFEIKDIISDIDLYVEVVESEKVVPSGSETTPPTQKEFSKLFSSGDTTNITIYIILAVAALAVIAVIIIKKKK